MAIESIKHKCSTYEWKKTHLTKFHNEMSKCFFLCMILPNKIYNFVRLNAYIK